MTTNANFDTLLSTTLNNYQKRLTDNIFTARPLTKWLSDKGRMRMDDGGVKIIEPIIMAQNSTVGSYSGYVTISLTAQTGITAAEYDWKQLAGSIAISGIEEAQNSGDSRVLNLLEAKIMQLEMSLQEKLNTMFFANGTGNSGKDWNGLENLVTSTTGTVGNINRATATWWQAKVTALGGALTQAAMTTMWNNCSIGNDTPDGIFTTQALFEKYEALLTPNLRYTDTDLAKAGFQNLIFKTAPVLWDVHNPAGIVYFLNSKYLTLVGHKDRWFEQTAFVRPENMDARYALITAYGNLTLRNSAKQGKITGAT
jgi:hypothetical protein